MVARKQTLSTHPLTGLRRAELPYSPSWIDRFNERISRLPVPPWLVYLCLWALLVILENLGTWLDGTQPVGKLRWISIPYAFYGVFFLTAIHYLDTWAKKALDSFRPILGVDEEAASLLFYQLTTMPARTVWLLTVAGIASLLLLYRPLVLPLWQAMGFTHRSAASTLIDLAIFCFNSLFLWVFIYHTLRQLRWVSRIHRSAARIDIFRLRPLYALSGLTARTAMTLLLVGYVVAQQTVSNGRLTTDPYILHVSWVFMLFSMLFYSLLGVSVFFFPLLGLHQVLLREKERLQAEADTRLQAHIRELHRRIDARDLQDADAMNKHMASLALERDILARLPTWPWQPGTLNLIASAVLLPIVLWLLQQLLSRWAGF